MLPRTTFALAALLALLIARSAFAQVAGAITITFDENGNGTVRPFLGPASPLISLGNQPDPLDPGNAKLPLVYDLQASIGFPVQPGDIDLIESPIPEVPPSDLLRFTPNGLLVVYSDNAEPGETPSLADVGIPLGFRQPNRAIFQETGPEGGPNGLFDYQPSGGQPGVLPVGAPVFAVYNFYSDVPEPSAAMVGAAMIMLASRRSKRRV